MAVSEMEVTIVALNTEPEIVFAEKIVEKYLNLKITFHKIKQHDGRVKLVHICLLD